MFPKIIHQTYKSEAQLSDAQKRSQRSWKQQNPGFAYMFWSDAENRKLIQEHYPWFLATFDGFPHNIQRADAVRYFILHRFGGVYVDMDVDASKPITPYLNVHASSDVILGVSACRMFDGHVSNFLMASKQGSSFWPIVWQEMQMKKEEGPALMERASHHVNIMRTTGPAMLHAAYEKANLVPSISVARFPREYVANNDVCNTVGSHDKASQFAVNQYGMSWVTWDTKLINLCYCKVYKHKWKWSTLLLLLLLSFGSIYYSKFVQCRKTCPRLSSGALVQ
jgi:mannosyltransferase OCH1-like enzyme